MSDILTNTRADNEQNSTQLIELPSHSPGSFNARIITDPESDYYYKKRQPFSMEIDIADIRSKIECYLFNSVYWDGLDKSSDEYFLIKNGI